MAIGTPQDRGSSRSSSSRKPGAGNLYQQSQYSGEFVGSAQSRAFNPVKAIDASSKERQKAEAKLRDLETQETSMMRQQRLDTKYLEAEHGIARANQEAKNRMINGIISLSKTALEGVELFQQEAEQQKKNQDLTKAAFGLSQSTPEGVERKQRLDQAARDNNTAAIGTESAIQQVAPNDIVLQNDLRQEQRQTLAFNQQRRNNVYEADTDLPGYWQQRLLDSKYVYTMPNGETFTATTVSNSEQLNWMINSIAGDFYRDAGLGEMDAQMVAQVLVPTVDGLRRSTLSTFGQQIAAGQIASSKEKAFNSITTALNKGVDIETIFNQGFTEVFGSGGYIGNMGGANKDTVQHILDWAEVNDRPDVIEALAQVEKIKGNAGTKLGRQYFKEFDDARDGVISERLQDNQRTRNAAIDAIKMADRERALELGQASPEQEAAINEKYAVQFESLGTPEGDMKARELRSKGLNYSPFTVLDLQEQQANGMNFSQDYLQEQIDNRDLTVEDAKKLGYVVGATKSEGDMRAEKVQSFAKEAESIAKTALTAVVKKSDTGQTLDSTAQQLLISGNASVVADMKEELLKELNIELQENPDWENKDVRQWMTERGRELIPEVEYDKKTGLIKYEFGPKEDKTAYTATNADGKTVISYVGEAPEALAQYRDVDVKENPILSRRELTTAGIAWSSNKPYPESVEAKAAALGTNAETLFRGQADFYKPFDYELPEKVTPPSPPSPPSGSRGSVPEEFDTGEVVGGVSLDRLRDSIISKESGNRFDAVNPHSGALGYGQVMPENIKSWTTAALGYEVSQREFLRTPSIQMAVINDRFRKMMNDQAAAGYSGEILMRRVASTWYSGQPSLYNNTRRQTYGAGVYPSIASYTLDVVSRYNNH